MIGERTLLIGAALLLVIALCKPTLPAERALFDHIIVLDVTQSMNVEDEQIDGKPASRLEWARHALRSAMLQLPCGSKVGWGLFTEYRSYLLVAPVEVCANLQELRSTLAQIDGRMAWAGNSEIAKGLFSGIRTAKQLDGSPSLVFVTDGQEAPPLKPEHRPGFDGKAGEVRGLIVGVGGLVPLPIPKRDPLGRPLGFWRPDEVLQNDPRGSSDSGKSGGGAEHLSSLREAYLKGLADQTGLRYLRPAGVAALADALSAPALARAVPARLDLRPVLAGLALALLLARHWRRSRRGAAPGVPARPMWRRRASP